MSPRRRNGADPLSSQFRILGIDPGLNGGWEVVNEKGRLLYCGSLPTTVDPFSPDKRVIDALVFAQMIEMVSPTISLIEAVSSRPRQQGVFRFGVGVGMVLGALSISGIPCRQVSPAAWKATYGLRSTNLPPLDGGVTPDKVKRLMKDEARKVATSLYPDWAEQFEQVKDDGVAEAVLIALHGLATNSLTNLVATLNGAAEPH